MRDRLAGALTRRRLLQLAGSGAALTALSVVTGRQLYGSAPVSPWHPSRWTEPVFGLLQAERGMYADLDGTGISAVTLSVPWSRAQPEPGRLDQAYLRDVERTYREARASGLHLALSPGLQYPPRWVTELPDARFVDQHGQTWRGPVGDDVVDAVFNDEVREAQGRYLRLLGERMQSWDLAGVRIGGLGRGELHYPPVDRSGTRNTYWAFGAAARETSPVPDFRPGEGSRREAAAFLDWYLDALRGYGQWQVDTVRRHFGNGPQLLLLLPSWGVRPGEVQAAVESRLDGSSSGERRGTLTEGVDWERHVRDIAAGTAGVDVCTTWLDPEDQGGDLGRVSPGRFLAVLARRHGVGVWGENTGDNPREELRRCVRRVQALDLKGLFWMGAEDLGKDGNASLDDYADLIRDEEQD